MWMMCTCVLLVSVHPGSRCEATTLLAMCGIVSDINFHNVWQLGDSRWKSLVYHSDMFGVATWNASVAGFVNVMTTIPKVGAISLWAPPGTYPYQLSV